MSSGDTMDADAAAGSPGKAASGEVEQAPAPGGPPPAAAAPDSDELTSEPVGQRPASRASDRPASRASDVSASASEADLAAAGRPGPPLPPLAELEASPFVDLQHPIGWYEGAKLVLMAPVVVFKLLLLAVAVCYAWAILVLLLLGHTPHTPMRPFRQFLVRQWIHQWGRFLLFVSGFYVIPVRGRRNLAAAEACRALLVFNHPSYVDAAVIATMFTPSGVSKAGVASIPFIGRFGVALQLFFIERRGAGDRSNSRVLKGDPVKAIAERAAERRFPLLALAPEATTKAQPCLLQFRRGAFVAGRPVCPVLLRYTYRHFNPGWGVCYTPFHVFRLLAQFVNHLEVEVLPPYQPSAAELRDWRLFAGNVRRLMGQRLGVPLVEQGLEDERQLWRWGVSVNLRGSRLLVPAAAAERRAPADEKED